MKCKRKKGTAVLKQTNKKGRDSFMPPSQFP